MHPIQFGHPPPFWVEVGLGEYARDIRTDAQRVTEKLDFRFRVLLRSIRHQQHGVRGRQCSEGGQRVHRIETAQTG